MAAPEKKEPCIFLSSSPSPTEAKEAKKKKDKEKKAQIQKEKNKKEKKEERLCGHLTRKRKGWQFHMDVHQRIVAKLPNTWMTGPGAFPRVCRFCGSGANT